MAFDYSAPADCFWRSGKAVRVADVVASQLRQRLFDLPSKVSLLSGHSALGCRSVMSASTAMQSNAFMTTVITH
jgi:hypothetical protein